MTSFTPEELAQRWKCSARHVRRLITSGRLAHFKLGYKLIRVSEQAVERFEAGACDTGLSVIEKSGASTGEKTARQDAIRLARETL